MTSGDDVGKICPTQFTNLPRQTSREDDGKETTHYPKVLLSG